MDEIIRRKHECEKKFKLEDYKKGLEKFIEVKYPLSTNALEKLWDMAEIPEEDRPAYKKTDYLKNLKKFNNCTIKRLNVLKIVHCAVYNIIEK